MTSSALALSTVVTFVTEVSTISGNLDGGQGKAPQKLKINGSSLAYKLQSASLNL